MTEQKFRSEMRRADALRKTCDDPMMSEYWAGYIRGVRRAFHGEKFGTEDEHKKWMTAVDSRDESRQKRGRGYRDGLAFGDISSKMGRPPMSDEATETIGVRLPESVIARIPEPRSEWMRNLIMKNLRDCSHD